MSKYQPLSERLAGHEGPEWQASFAEIEEVLGFPLPKGARAGRAWWGDADKSHARSWAQQGFEAHVDPSAATVTFRRSDIAPAAVDAVLPPVGEIPAEPIEATEAPSTPAAEPNPTTSAKPVAAASGDLEPVPASVEPAEDIPPRKVGAVGAAALVAAGLALVAGLGALVVKAVGRRA